MIKKKVEKKKGERKNKKWGIEKRKMLSVGKKKLSCEKESRKVIRKPFFASLFTSLPSGREAK